MNKYYAHWREIVEDYVEFITHEDGTVLYAKNPLDNWYKIDSSVSINDMTILSGTIIEFLDAITVEDLFIEHL